MDLNSETSSPHIKENQRKVDYEYYQKLNEYFTSSSGTNLDKLRAFTKYTPVGEINKFLVKNELFKKIVNVHGSIIECGVFNGAGLMSWANLSTIYEPLNHTRKIIGFDSFEGFLDIDEKDRLNNNNPNLKKGCLESQSYEDILECASIFDIYRPLGHIPKIELVKGDALATIPKYIEENQYLIVSLLYLDFDLYEPTKAAIEEFLPRMPKGAVIAFDELHQKTWPGETIALNDTIGIKNVRIQRFEHYPQISYIVLD